MPSPSRRSPFRGHLGRNTSSTRELVRKTVARAFCENDAKRGRLRCANKHKWASDLDPRSEDRAGFVTPKCPECGEFFNDFRINYGTFDASIKCRTSCKVAVGDVCRCECAGSNHGFGEDAPDEPEPLT